MPDGVSAEERLVRLRMIISNARSMPMSASCVVNRAEVLGALDELSRHLPTEIAAAQQVIEESERKVAEGEAQAGEIVAEAREHAADLASDKEQVKIAEAAAAKIVADAEEEAAALRRETEVFIDSRMASFESVLAKTGSQVRLARRRLAERSDAGTERARVTDLPELD